MRVAFISFAFGEYSIYWANGLAEYADVLLALPPQEDAFVGMIDRRVRFFELSGARMRHVIQQLKSMWQLARELRAFKPDVIHLQQGFIWFNLLIPILFRYPLVITIHDPQPHMGDSDQRQPQFIFRFGFAQARRFIVHGSQLKEICVSRLGLRPDTISIIPHIKLGQETVEPRPISSATILFFGRIWEYKGLHILIQAESLLAAAIPDVKIMIAGTGEDFERYRAMMVDPSRYIIHNAFIPDETVAELFLDSAVVVLPYLEATQSGVIPLAYTYGRPVVATRVGALPDAVDDGITGLLVPPGDVQALADAIIRLLADRPLAQTMGNAGRKKINEEASPDAVARQSMQVYAAALQD